MIAAERGHATVVQRLIEASADPLARDLAGKRAWDLAVDEQVRAVLERL
jgi:ankyrin repeat protein